VAVAEGRVGELDRDEGLRLGLVVARAVVEQLVHELASNRTGKEVVDDQPLVVPPEGAASLREQLSLSNAVGSETVHQRVVGADERQLHLTHEDVGVVARVAEEGDAFLIARDIPVVLEQLCGVLAAIEIRRAHRTTAVEGLEAGPRGAHVPQREHVGVGAQRRAIRGQVVGDVLAEERPTRLGSRVTVRVASVGEPTDGPDLMQQRLVYFEGGQVEHPPVATSFTERCLDSLRFGRSRSDASAPGRGTVEAESRHHRRPGDRGGVPGSRSPRAAG
jgi:hypothetical protein